jgi:malonate-semialdehyde dehydrogenase (acetylating)/methylmalonate-semialdehyde dehydrogenase
MLQLLQEAGLPKGVVNLVTTSRKEAQLLLSHPAVKGISYVGSSAVGKNIYANAAAGGKRVQVLGEAKNHGLVLRDANLVMTARAIINASFGCAGMRCMALPTLVVEDASADELVPLLVSLARERRVGCAYRPETELGPVVSAEHRQAIFDWIAKGVEEGAQLVLDGPLHLRPTHI